MPTIINGVSYEDYHGSPFDRGSADSYYGRSPRPHKGGTGGPLGSTPITDLTPEETKAYFAGYEWNEDSGEKKYR